MDSRLLRTLVTIADTGSFSAAGDMCGLTQSAISLHIKALEDELGHRLFDRSKRPPILNARGRALVARAREYLALGQQIHDDFSTVEPIGNLELGAVPSCLTGLLPQALADLRASHAHFRIRVTSGLSAELTARVMNGELDVAVVSEPAHLPREANWYGFAREPLLVIAPADARGDGYRALLEAHPFIMFSTRTWAGRQINQHIQDHAIPVRVNMEIDSLEAIVQMVRRGLGVSVIPSRYGETPLPAGIRSVPFGSPPHVRAIGLIERSANPKAHLVSTLHGQLKQLCDRDSTR
jgi:DNA-binding transcriptional LysR family regulator